MELNWISVKERLPEIVQDMDAEISESKEVIVCLKNKEVYKAKLTHWFEDDFEPEHFYFYYSDSGEHITGGDVTHWIYFNAPTQQPLAEIS